MSKYGAKDGTCKKCGMIRILQPSSLPFCPTQDCPNYRKFLVDGVLDYT